jgi:hypothetical protein
MLRDTSQSWPDRPGISRASERRRRRVAGVERLAHRAHGRRIQAARLEQQLELHGGDGQLVVRVVQTVAQRLSGKWGHSLFRRLQSINTGCIAK